MRELVSDVGKVCLKLFALKNPQRPSLWCNFPARKVGLKIAKMLEGLLKRPVRPCPRRSTLGRVYLKGCLGNTLEKVCLNCLPSQTHHLGIHSVAILAQAVSKWPQPLEQLLIFGPTPQTIEIDCCGVH